MLPLSISTAASGLFVQLGMPDPTPDPKPTERKILIWGGSSSCGSSAIQLAAAAGFGVVTTASVANFQYVKELGAEEVFDHRDPESFEAIVKTLKSGDVVLDCIATADTQAVCGNILSKIGGGKLPTLLWPQGPFPDNVEGVLGAYNVTSLHFVDMLILRSVSSKWPRSWPCQSRRRRRRLAEVYSYCSSSG